MPIIITRDLSMTSLGHELLYDRNAFSPVEEYMTLNEK